MFAWWGRAVVQLRWLVLAAGFTLVVVGSTWGAAVFGDLTGGGFDDPASESSRTLQRITTELGDQSVDVLVLYSSPGATADQPAFRDPVTRTLKQLAAHPDVASVTSWYDTQAPQLISSDRHATYAAIRLRAADEDAKSTVYKQLRPSLDAPGVRTQVGGEVAFLEQVNRQTTEDLSRAEMFSLPVLLLLLILIFRGVVAAATPLLVGGAAILGAFITTRLLTTVTDVSIFAINLITLLGLGMAIDYALFVVSRFREELAAGLDVPAAIERTVATAGRTVAVSGLTIALALSSLLIFPQTFLRSMGWGGVSAVLVAMLASLTLLPALLAVLGTRINALRIPLPWGTGRGRSTGGEQLASRWSGRIAIGQWRRDLRADWEWLRRRVGISPPAGAHAATVDGADYEGAWARLARSVMARPVLYAAGVLVALALLSAPFLHMRLGGLDERVLPAGTEARVVAERVGHEFDGGSSTPILVLVSGASTETIRPFTRLVDGLPGVTGVRVTAEKDSAVLLSVAHRDAVTSPAAKDLVRTIRGLPTPDGAEVLVGGRTAADIDLVDGLVRRLPWMALLMGVSTLVLLFLAFGSLVLPIKAVLMNVISISASFGVVVWAFQDGYLAGLLGFTSLGFIDSTNPILLLAVLFGLATDYEVFLLSRIREEWDRTSDNAASVAAGMQATGRIITAAAALLVVVVVGFAAGDVLVMKVIGVGMIVAIVVDATLVRALLVPATMRLLGGANWWAPAPLDEFYLRYGIHEAALGTAANGRHRATRRRGAGRHRVAWDRPPSFAAAPTGLAGLSAAEWSGGFSPSAVHPGRNGGAGHEPAEAFASAMSLLMPDPERSGGTGMSERHPGYGPSTAGPEQSSEPGDPAVPPGGATFEQAGQSR